MHSENDLQKSDHSDKLDQKENNKLCSFLTEKGLLSQATAVAQLYLSEKPDHKKWTKKHTGVLCFIKDYKRKSFFFHVYNINTLQLLWEQELYKPFKYNKLTSQFHYFDADECIAGLNFGCENEAIKFNDVVLDRIKKRDIERKSRKTVKKAKPTNYQENFYLDPVDESKPNSTLSSIPLTLNINSSNIKQVESIIDPKLGKNKKSIFGNIIGKFMIKSEEKKPINKLEISAPTNFKHKQHVGSDGNMILEDEIMNTEMKKILAEAKLKVTDENLEMMKELIVNSYNIQDFAKEIYETIETDEPAIIPQQLPKKKQYQTYESKDLINFDDIPSKPPPPVPSVPPPLPPNPMKQNQQQKLPPPPPPLPVAAKNPDQPVIASGGPPPPPPPPPPGLVFQSDTPVASVIKKASTPQKVVSPVSDNSALLQSISAFNKGGLKPVDALLKPEKPVEKSMRNDLIEKLAGMRAFIQESDDEEEEEDTDDEEWKN